ncbi:MAG: DEAD/DEAH box helicase [Armatimonadetes bacterium]|nr:DEAD/DEAH box helicase [Armatimonadota bacterium]
MQTTIDTKNFHALGVSKRLCELLKRNNIVTPTPIQEESIPIGIEGHDLIGLAQTGTGKTLAFGLPLASNLNPGEVALVLAPTRELAHQIEETLRSLHLICVLLIGGAPMPGQIHKLRRPHQVIIATPGRLEDHLSQRTMKLDRVKIVVLDEADRMLDMGFAPSIQRILAACPKDRQTMLFSATMPNEIVSLADSYLNNPHRVEVAQAGTASELVSQSAVFLQHHDKLDMLTDILSETRGPVLVFARTRFGAQKLNKHLNICGFKSAEIHSDRSLNQRREALAGFKRGYYQILVATDIAARGIDVKEIELVLNFDMPDNPDDYVHRIGRTGRAGAEGHSILFVIPDQMRTLREIEKLIRQGIPVSPLSKIEVPEHLGAGGKRGGRGRNVNRENSRPKRQVRSSKPDRFARPDSRDTAESTFERPKFERPQSDRPQFERPQFERSERTNRPERAERPREDFRPARAERPSRDERPFRGDRQDRNARPERKVWNDRKPSGPAQDRGEQREYRPSWDSKPSQRPSAPASSFGKKKFSSRIQAIGEAQLREASTSRWHSNDSGQRPDGQKRSYGRPAGKPSVKSYNKNSSKSFGKSFGKPKKRNAR